MKNKILRYLVMFMTLVFVGCGASKYNEPTNVNSTAKLIVNQKDLLANYAFPLEIRILLDNQVISEDNYPEMSVLVSQGKHILSLDITSFYHGYRVKHNSSKVYEITFKAGEVYTISSKVEKERLENQKDDVEAYYSIEGLNVSINEKVVLMDDYLKTSYGGTNNPNDELVKSVIQSVIIPGM